MTLLFFPVSHPQSDSGLLHKLFSISIATIQELLERVPEGYYYIHYFLAILETVWLPSI